MAHLVTRLNRVAILLQASLVTTRHPVNPVIRHNNPVNPATLHRVTLRSKDTHHSRDTHHSKDIHPNNQGTLLSQVTRLQHNPVITRQLSSKAPNFTRQLLSRNQTSTPNGTARSCTRR